MKDSKFEHLVPGRFTDQCPDQMLKALSWKQPFGSLMLHGKDETRVWDTKYRGWVMICASKAPYLVKELKGISGDYQMKRIKQVLEEAQDPTKDLCGHAIGIGWLESSATMMPDQEDACFVEYSPMLYVHKYTGMVRIQPIPWSGILGFTKVPDEFKEKIMII